MCSVVNEASSAPAIYSYFDYEGNLKLKIYAKLIVSGEKYVELFLEEDVYKYDDQ